MICHYHNMGKTQKLVYRKPTSNRGCVGNPCKSRAQKADSPAVCRPQVPEMNPDPKAKQLSIQLSGDTYQSPLDSQSLQQFHNDRKWSLRVGRVSFVHLILQCNKHVFNLKQVLR